MITGEKRKAFYRKKDRLAPAQAAIEAQQNAAPSPEARQDDAFYEGLLEFVVSLANKLQACGAETYRVEETINRIAEAYGVERVDAFVIPSSVMASIETDGGRILTKIRRLKSGETMLDTSALTGESIPREVNVGDEVSSGCINLSGFIRLRTTKPFGESTASRILNLVENASSKTARQENSISSLLKWC